MTHSPPPLPVLAELTRAVSQARGQSTIVSNQRITALLTPDQAPATLAWLENYREPGRALTVALKGLGLTVRTKLRGGKVNAWEVRS